jgi:hypothetical protein
MLHRLRRNNSAMRTGLCSAVERPTSRPFLKTISVLWYSTPNERTASFCWSKSMRSSVILLNADCGNSSCKIFSCVLQVEHQSAWMATNTGWPDRFSASSLVCVNGSARGFGSRKNIAANRTSMIAEMDNIFLFNFAFFFKSG